MTSEERNKWSEKIVDLLLDKPELRMKLIEALETDRYFISMTFVKITDPKHPELDLQHTYFRRNFKVDDVVKSLKHIASDFNAKENPTAEIPKDGNWH